MGNGKGLRFPVKKYPRFDLDNPLYGVEEEPPTNFASRLADGVDLLSQDEDEYGNTIEVGV